MIQYALKCAEGHSFDSWFQSSAAFDKLQAAGMVTCAVCGTADVKKLLMAPSVRPARKAATSPPQTGAEDPAPEKQPAPTEPRPLSAPASAQEQALRAFKQHVEANSEYVGDSFATKAREMHDGTAPQASIYGEARPEEARALVEDGIPVVPLPFRPNSRNN